MGNVAQELLGAPNGELSTRTELRYGSRGSLSVDLRKGVWSDFERGAAGGVVDLVIDRRGGTKDEAIEWLRERGHIEKTAGSKEIAATYDYTSSDGELLFQVVRFVPKDFRQRRPDGIGGWVWKMTGVERVLYRLPEVLKAVSEGHTVYITEGEKSADALRGLGLVATCSPGGAGKWRATYNPPLAGASVVILPDNDEPGQEHAQAVLKSLSGLLGSGRTSVRILDLPGLPPKGDPYDWIMTGGTAGELERLAKEVPETEAVAPKKNRRKESLGQASDGPLIRVIAGELHNTSTQAEAALLQSDLPIFQRGSALVRPVVQDVPAARGRMTVSAALHEMDGIGLVDALCGVANWERYDARAEDWLRINPPRNVADVMLSRVGMWKFPKIVGVITTPTIRPDGSILSEPGYDPATRLYHAADPDITLSPVALEPTKEIALKAMDLLNALLSEFPFVTAEGEERPKSVSHAVALSALITPIVRGALSVAPLHAFAANTAGSGKSFLVDLASAISSGRPCPVVAAGADEAETEKRLAGLLLAGFPIASLDNCNGELGGDLLCQAIERPFIRLRPLGRSDIIEIESRATLFATGNALRVRGDMVRRTLLCDLDANMERPELRKFESDPVAVVMANRGRYVSACLAIVRAYILAGRPDRKSSVASFTDWSDTVRSALCWLGCADPADSMERAREDDPELAELREVTTLWRDNFGLVESLTAKELADRAEERTKTQIGEPTDYVNPEWRDCLLRIVSERGAVSTKRLGYWLRNREGRIVDGLRLSKATSAGHGGLVRWTVRKAGR
jgi:putative DNA primase/helicase